MKFSLALLFGAVAALPQASENEWMQPDEHGEYTITSLKLTAKVRIATVHGPKRMILTVLSSFPTEPP
jgi:hypothetical protein